MGMEWLMLTSDHRHATRATVVPGGLLIKSASDSLVFLPGELRLVKRGDVYEIVTGRESAEVSPSRIVLDEATIDRLVKASGQLASGTLTRRSFVHQLKEILGES